MIFSISKKSELCNNDFDGVIEFEDLNGQAQIRNNPFDMDLLSPDEGVDWVNATGPKKKKGMFSGMKARKAQRQDRRDTRVQSKADARVMKAGAAQTKAGAKVLAAKAQGAAAKAMGKGDDKALLAALATDAPVTPDKKGMSTGMKVGIVAGILVLIVGGVILYKKMKKK